MSKKHPDDDYQIPEFDEDEAEPAEDQEEEEYEEQVAEEGSYDSESSESDGFEVESQEDPVSYDDQAGSEEVNEREVFDSAPSGSSGTSVDKKVVNMSADVPLQIVAVLGKKMMTVRDVVSMKMGQVLELNRLPNEAIDLVANGKLIAKGELVEVEGKLGIRILKIFD